MEERVDAQLGFHRLHGTRFLEFMASCRGVMCTAGFESVSEAAWLGKAVLAMPVPGHVEQALNAVDASHCGLAISTPLFDLDPLLTALRPQGRERFRAWVSQSDARLDRALEAASVRSTEPRLAPDPWAPEWASTTG